MKHWYCCVNTSLLSSPLRCSCWISSKTSLLYIIHGPICAALLVRSLRLFSWNQSHQQSNSHVTWSMFSLGSLFLLRNVAFAFFRVDTVGGLKAAHSFVACVIVFILWNQCICSLWGSTHRSPEPVLHSRNSPNQQSRARFRESSPLRLSQDDMFSAQTAFTMICSGFMPKRGLGISCS